jgi:fluoride exporter
VSRAVHDRPAPEAVATRPRRRNGMHLDGRELSAIFAGGFAGVAARAEIGDLLVHPTGGWPWATLIVNVAGAFLLGYFVTRLQERLPLSAYRRPFLGTGVCGGLTTFSAMQVELLQMLDAGRVGLALAYAIVSIVAGFAGVAVATNLVRRTRLTA